MTGYEVSVLKLRAALQAALRATKLDFRSILLHYKCSTSESVAAVTSIAILRTLVIITEVYCPVVMQCTKRPSTSPSFGRLSAVMVCEESLVFCHL